MGQVTFVKDYRHPIDPLTEARYRSGNSYTVTAEVEAAARAAGALEEKASDRPARRARKGGAGASQG